MSSDAPPRCVGGVLAPFRSPPNNCLRGVKWSPDGLCLLTASDDHHLRLFELPEHLQTAEALQATAAAHGRCRRRRCGRHTAP